MYRAYYRDSPLDWSESKVRDPAAGHLGVAGAAVGGRPRNPAAGNRAGRGRHGLASASRGTCPASFGWRASVAWKSRNRCGSRTWRRTAAARCRPLPCWRPCAAQSLEIRDFQPQPQDRRDAAAACRRGRRPDRHAGQTGDGGGGSGVPCRTHLLRTAAVRSGVGCPAGLDGRSWSRPSRPMRSRTGRSRFAARKAAAIEIHFRRPLPADQPMRLTLHAHRRGVRPGERLRGRELRLGALRDVTVTRSVIAVAADAAHQLALVGRRRPANGWRPGTCRVGKRTACSPPPGPSRSWMARRRRK